jgi:[NiFe] hydrogenase assembly HybE family chaperone
MKRPGTMGRAMSADGRILDLAGRLETHFQEVWRRSMADVPICNPALSVASVGFREWSGQALGVVVTPWFMNIVMAPLEGAAPVVGKSGDAKSVWLPAGKVDFLVSELDGFGPLLMCSLFSPMGDFRDHETAVATAGAAMEALLDRQFLAEAPEPEIYPTAADEPRKTPAERAEVYRQREAEGTPQLDRRAFFLRSERKAPPQ